MPTKHSNTPAITFTLDVEDHRPGPHAELRFPHLTREVLAFLAERNIVGTFFIVGSMAAEHPDLVAEIAASGHEIGLHSWQHVPITSMTPEQFATDIGRGKDVIEQMISAPVVGYRAPTYSLTPKVSWARRGPGGQRDDGCQRQRVRGHRPRGAGLIGAEFGLEGVLGDRHSD